MKSDSKPVKFFLVIEGVRGTNGKISSVKLAHAALSRPKTLEENQTCFAMKLNVPVAAFEVPVYDINIEASDLIPHEIIAEVESWIVSDIE